MYRERLVGAVDGLLQRQAGFDVKNLERYLNRSFTERQRQEIYDRIFAAKRYCFIESGVTHPNFADLFGEVTNPNQQAKVRTALEGMLQTVA